MTIKCLGCGNYVTLLAPLGSRGKFGKCTCSNRTDLVPIKNKEWCVAEDFGLVQCWDAPSQEFVKVEDLLYVNKIR